MRHTAPLLLLTLGACIANGGAVRPKPGDWVEAKGKIENGRAVVTDIGKAERAADDKPDKIELLGPVTAASKEQVEMLGTKLNVDADTDYEDAQKQKLEPFVGKPDEWLRIKVRNKNESLRARTIRKSDPKGSFRVTGELRQYDDQADEVDIGGVKLPVTQNVDMGLGGGRNADDPLSMFLADDQKSVPFSIRAGDNLRFGGQGSATITREQDYDLGIRADARTKAQEGGKLDALWLMGDSGSYAMFEIAFGRTDSNRGGSSDLYRRDEQFEITRAMASINVADTSQVLIGRQDFFEERRWLYDDVLDGVRILKPVGPWDFEGGIATGRAVAAENNPTEDTSLFETNVTYHVDPDWTMGAYVLKRLDDSVFAHEPLLYGLRSLARPRYGLGHWVELGGASGSSTFRDPASPNRFDADLLGFAFDVGATWTFESSMRPTIAVGYALGTGAGANAKKQGYRQSGYNDNNAKLGGVTSVHYYGEVLRPELSNIGIATIAAAIRPTRDSSVSLLFHHYVQDTPTTFSPVNALRPTNSTTTGIRNPNGRSAELGYEVDFVIGYRMQGRLTAELTAGRFEPGAAFDSQEPADKIEFTFRYSF